MNESRKETIAKLEDKIRNFKKASLKTNELFNKIEVKEALKQKQVDIMRHDSEMKNVYTTKPWADVCGGGLVSNSPIMHVIN